MIIKKILFASLMMVFFTVPMYKAIAYGVAHEEFDGVLTMNLNQPELFVLKGMMTSQVILIMTEGKVGDYRAKLKAFELGANGDWQSVFINDKENIAAVIGRNGLSDNKVEGDGCSPQGIYYVGLAFGYLNQIDTGLKYRAITKNDYWVDDIVSSEYNRWLVSLSKPNVSAEVMYRDDGLYKYGVVIEYNTDKPVKGKGSAIFLHIWRDADTPTAGCVAIAERDIIALLKWLDVKKNPVIVIQQETSVN